jgi:hypothetical protein
MHAAFQHGLALRLGQYLDFRRLLERIPPDPSEAFAVARTAHAESAVAVALEAAAVVVGAPVPDALRAAFEPYLSPPLARCVRGVTPLALVAPAQPGLARLRWALAAGRRRQLVAATLGLGAPGSASLLQRGLLVARRAAGLLQRWGVPVLRDAVATAWTRGARR